MKSFSTLRDTQRGSLFLKTMVCFSGCLMSSASLQKLFCGVCSVLKCSFEEFVREKVVFRSYSSAILGPPLLFNFSLGQLLELIYHFDNIIKTNKQTKDTHWDIHKSRQTDANLIVFHLIFKMSLWPPLFFEVLVCPRPRSEAKWAVYFRDMKRVNFKLFPRQAF